LGSSKKRNYANSSLRKWCLPFIDKGTVPVRTKYQTVYTVRYTGNYINLCNSPILTDSRNRSRELVENYTFLAPSSRSKLQVKFVTNVVDPYQDLFGCPGSGFNWLALIRNQICNGSESINMEIGQD
jgi:hypothetical protein